MVVLTKFFEEDEGLREKFKVIGNKKTRVLYNTLNPVYGEAYEMPVQMDTKIFDYLKSKRAVFEVRHYIV